MRPAMWRSQWVRAGFHKFVMRDILVQHQWPPLMYVIELSLTSEKLYAMKLRHVSACRIYRRSGLVLVWRETGRGGCA